MKREDLLNELDEIFENLLVDTLPIIKGLDNKEYSPEDIVSCLSYDLTNRMKEDYYDLVCNLVIDTTNRDFDISCEDTFSDIVDKYLPEIYEEMKAYSDPEKQKEPEPTEDYVEFDLNEELEEKRTPTRLYKLEHHFGKWYLEEGFVIFEPDIHFFSQLDDENNRAGEEVNITNLYDGALIYFDEDGQYHMVDEKPLISAFHALMGAANTKDTMLQRMTLSLLDDYLANPDIIPKDKEQEYVKTRGE